MPVFISLRFKMLFFIAIGISIFKLYRYTVDKSIHFYLLSQFRFWGIGGTLGRELREREGQPLEI